MYEIFSKYTERYSAKSFDNITFTDQNKQKTRDEYILYTHNDEYSTKIYNTAYNINGDVGYMCPNCYTVSHIKTQVDNNASIIFDNVSDDDITDIESSNIKLSVHYDVTMKCPVCKYIKPHIRLDNNIADSIGILNIKGYITARSSEGYKSIDGISGPYIRFNFKPYYSSKRISMIESYIESTLPLSWYVDRPSYCMSYTTMSEDTLLRFPVKRMIPVYAPISLEIKADYYNKEEALRDILKWSRSLPDPNNSEENI